MQNDSKKLDVSSDEIRPIMKKLKPNSPSKVKCENKKQTFLVFTKVNDLHIHRSLNLSLTEIKLPLKTKTNESRVRKRDNFDIDMLQVRTYHAKEETKFEPTDEHYFMYHHYIKPINNFILSASSSST